MRECEIVTSHVALDSGETTEHLVTTCSRTAVAIVDDNDDDVIVCGDHLKPGMTIVYDLREGE